MNVLIIPMVSVKLNYFPQARDQGSCKFEFKKGSRRARDPYCSGPHTSTLLSHRALTGPQPSADATASAPHQGPEIAPAPLLPMTLGIHDLSQKARIPHLKGSVSFLVGFGEDPKR